MKAMPTVGYKGPEKNPPRRHRDTECPTLRFGKAIRAYGPRSSKAGSAFGGGARQAFEGPLGAAAEGVAEGTSAMPPCLSASVVDSGFGFHPAPVRITRTGGLVMHF